MQLRSAEWINLVAFPCFALLALTRRDLSAAQRRTIVAIGAAGIAITLIVSLVVPNLTSLRAAVIIRDWIPLLLLPLFYWQGGQFVIREDVDFENKLERLDARLVAPVFDRCLRSPLRDWIFIYLEIGYLSYYLVLPLSLAALHIAGKDRGAGLFWTVVLLAAYGSCATLPFLNTRPPRVLGEKWSTDLPQSKVRAFNLWVLRQGSIQANTCPSAHVAIGAACALVLWRLAPLWVGLVFLWLAVTIALGAVGGRYHYALDAALGGASAVAAFLIGIALAG